MDHNGNRIGRITATTAVIAAAVAVTFGVGWLLAGTGSDPTRNTGAAAAPTATATPATPDRAGTGGPGPASATQPAPGSGGNGQTEPGAAGPRIESFQVAQQPQCPGGTDLNPIEGQPVVLQWRVTGVDEVTLSVDGPGAYGTYPAEGSDTINFPCEGGDGDLQEHTYLLTAVAGGVTVTDTLVVTAAVHDVTDV